jgi:hypothetical protein
MLGGLAGGGSPVSSCAWRRGEAKESDIGRHEVMKYVSLAALLFLTGCDLVTGPSSAIAPAILNWETDNTVALWPDSIPRDSVSFEAITWDGNCTRDPAENQLELSSDASGQVATVRLFDRVRRTMRGETCPLAALQMRRRVTVDRYRPGPLRIVIRGARIVRSSQTGLNEEPFSVERTFFVY